MGCRFHGGVVRRWTGAGKVERNDQLGRKSQKTEKGAEDRFERVKETLRGGSDGWNMRSKARGRSGGERKPVHRDP